MTLHEGFNGASETEGTLLTETDLTALILEERELKAAGCSDPETLQQLAALESDFEAIQGKK